jgi:hypothetical protein
MLRILCASAVLAAGTMAFALPTWAVTTIQVFDPRTEVTETFLNLGAEEFSAGDIVVERAMLFDPENGASIGRSVTRIQFLEVLAKPSDDNPMGDFEFILDCTVELEGGSIVFYGPGVMNQIMEGVTFAVMGGTGDYAGSRGTVTVKATEINDQQGVTMNFNLM